MRFIIAIGIAAALAGCATKNVKVYPFVEVSGSQPGHYIPEQGAVGIAIKGVF